jgi:putative tryptophan/tyrosine transport system substrate-binding protein
VILGGAVGAIPGISRAQLWGIEKSPSPSIRRAYYVDEGTADGRARFHTASKALNSSLQKHGIDLIHVNGFFRSESESLRSLIETIDTRREISAIFCANLATARAAKVFTNEKQKFPPIFFAIHSDPAGEGFASSLERPSGNMTGMTYNFSRHFKLVEAAAMIAPKTKTFGFLLDNALQAERKIEASTRAELGRLNHEMVAHNIEGAKDAALDVVRTMNQRGCRHLIALDTLPLSENNYALVTRLSQAGLGIITDYIPILDAGALLAVEPVLESPYTIWARQFQTMLSGYPVAEIPIESPTIFRRGFNLDVAQRLNIKLSRAQLASFDVLYSARNKRS